MFNNNKFVTSIVLYVGLICISPLLVAATLDDIKSVPHLDSAGQDGYRKFLASGKHRAFAIAPGGVWAWKGSAISAESASTEVMTTCENDGSQSCVIYAVDDKIVFDAHVWERLWGPYLDRTEASQAHIGLNRGERFYNLTFRNETGKPMSLSTFQGKAVLLHFWGSWCPPCRREIPDLQQLHQALGATPDIQMVLLQVQEDFDKSRQWVRRQRLNLPLFDSGAKGKEGDSLTLVDGTRMHGRDLAPAFPTTYILDKHGIIVFSNIGPVASWPEYLPLLRDVAKRSGN